MSLASGVRLGPYEILLPIGAGGMGEVYKARDTRLDRLVAVKILPTDTPLSPEARQRFEREARTISQLSHPHICTLYDVGHAEMGANRVDFLIMELLDGETLAQRLARGPLPFEEVAHYGGEIADALDKAHRRGIVHRDLKPANVMLTRAGTKLLDFGLAKTSPGPAVNDETVAAAFPVTGTGMVVGTLQYMAPEVLEGLPADSRSDIYAFGAVIYEMATGRKAFRADLQPLAPPALDRLVRACLTPNPDDRYQSAHDVGLQLAALTVKETTATTGSRRSGAAWIPWTIAALALLAAAVLAFRSSNRPSAAPVSIPPAVKFLQPPPDAGGFYQNVENTGLAVSPDGLRIALTARDASGVLHAWLRSASSASATLLPDTDGATSLFWSPDGRSLAFFAGPRLRRMDFPGGTPVTVCDVRDGIGFSGTWGADGQILFASIEGEAIYSVSASGGSATALLKPDVAKQEARLTWPVFLPDGRRFLYLMRSRDAGGRLMLLEPGKTPREVTPMQSNVGYVDPGYLVFGRDGTLVGQGFDLAKGMVVGAPFSIANPVNYFYTTALAQFAVSASGTLVYQPQSDVHHMVWFDRSGRETGRVSEDGQYRQLQISPDGRRLAFSRQAAGANDVWELDFERGAETRLTFGVSGEQSGPWMPDSRSLMFNADRGAPPEIFLKDLTTGAEKRVVPGSGTMQDPQDISPDGKTLLYVQRGNGGDHIWMVGLDGKRPPTQAIESNFEDYGVRFSRDGRYFSYSSNSSGRQEVYLSPFPPTGEKVRVSTAGGFSARWSRDTPELFYVSPAGQVMSAAVQTKPTLHVQSPVALFTVDPAHSWREFDVAPGNRFLALVLESRASGQPVTVVLNWSPNPQTATR